MRLYGAFTKVQKQADGTLYVEGVASSEAVDAAGEIVKASAMQAALPDYLKFPALREMHQLIAAGKTLAADVSEDGKTYIAAKVVDPVACKKVEEGVYAGFSIGGSVPPGGRSKDNPKIIEVLKLSEISLVDRPANPEAVISLVKIEDAAPPAEEKKAAVQTSGQVPAEEAKKAAPAAKQATTESATTKAGASPAAQSSAPATSPGQPVAKGMYAVGWAAELCGSLCALASETQFEADYEGDGSEIPGRLKTLCSEFAEILKDLVAEEVEELVAAKVEKATLDKPGVLKKSEKLATVARAFVAAAKGEDFATRAVEAEQVTKQAADALKKALDERDDLQRKLSEALLTIKTKGVPQDPKFLEAAVKAEELEKQVKDAGEAVEQAGLALKTVMAERDELQKQRDALQRANADAAKQASDALEKVLEEKGVLQKQLDEYVVKYAKAEVELKTKGYLKQVRSVEKAADVDSDPVVPETPPPEGTRARSEYELRKVHTKGGRLVTIAGPVSAPGETR